MKKFCMNIQRNKNESQRDSLVQGLTARYFDWPIQVFIRFISDDDIPVNDSLYFIPESELKTILVLLSVAVAVVCLGILIIVVTVIWIATK